MIELENVLCDAGDPRKTPVVLRNLEGSAGINARVEREGMVGEMLLE